MITAGKTPAIPVQVAEIQSTPCCIVADGGGSVLGLCLSAAESFSWSIHGPIIVTGGAKARFW